MAVSSLRFVNLPDLVLGPLAGRPAADWARAPAGKWSSAQIVHHLALALESSGRTFESRRNHAPMRRRPRTPVRLAGFGLVLGLGWYPSGFRAPESARPAVHPDRAAVERQFREGVDRFLVLERTLVPARRADLFVRHPAFGDLTLPEWLRFHVQHCRHPAKQIRERLGG
jgi:hypothetical protein